MKYKIGVKKQTRGYLYIEADSPFKAEEKAWEEIKTFKGAITTHEILHIEVYDEDKIKKENVVNKE